MKGSLALAAALLVLGTGCTTAVQRTAETSPVVCGFLGADLCAELQPGAKGEAGLRYVNPKGTFTQYDNVMLVMVSFFGSDPGKIKPQDEQRLTDLFYKNLHDALATWAGHRSVRSFVNREHSLRDFQSCVEPPFIPVFAMLGARTC